MKKICAITGSRADYGLLSPLLLKLKSSNKFQLQLAVTGTHISKNHGYTITEIVDDGHDIDKKIDIKLIDDTPSQIIKSTGMGMIGFSDAFEELKPDLVILLGDRFEILSAAFSAFIKNIPIAHIHGGESTEGAYDEGIRHSITKMSFWHFVATNDYKKRVIQLGEKPERVFKVGGLGVDLIKETKLLSKNELSSKLNIDFKQKNILVTYHPETLSKTSSHKSFSILLDALNDFKEIYIIFTMPNSDTNSIIIKTLINDFVKKNNDRAISFESMGYLNYLSTMNYVDGVVGNSSSGILEAPTFKIGTINIGDRQKGRQLADSVIQCKCSKKSIKDALKKMFSKNFNDKLSLVKNPYGEGNASNKIISILEEKEIPFNIKKKFYDII